MQIAVELLILFLFPALVVYLTKKVRFFGKVGAIALCYLSGFIISLLPTAFDKDLSQTVASVLIAIAIPLVLFSFDIRSVKKLARKTVTGFALLIVSVLTVSFVMSVFAARSGIEEGPALGGMAVGLYVGGTPNLFAVGSALLKDATVVLSANIADSLMGGVYYLLMITVIKKAYQRWLTDDRAGADSGEGIETDVPDTDSEYDYSFLRTGKSSLLRLAGVILLAVACLGCGVLLEILVNGNMDGSLLIMITVSVLGIVFSCFRKVRDVKGSYQTGQYLILVFSLGLSMSIDFGKLISEILPIVVFFTCVQVFSAVVHFILCRIFRVDGGTAIITFTAGIYGPPFIAPTANAYGDRRLIVPGIICGTVGLVAGNLLGIAFGSVFRMIIM